jgi:pyruvate dehydrogenase E1 component alpha subunit
MSDPAKYRTKEKLEEYKKEDPILILKSALFDQSVLSEEGFKSLDAECKQQVEEAVRFAEESPEPEIKTLYEDVLA